MVFISMLELGLIFARARQAFLRLVRLRVLQSFFFALGRIESTLNLDLSIFELVLDLWLFSRQALHQFPWFQVG